MDDDRWISDSLRRDGVRVLKHPQTEGAYIVTTRNGTNVTDHCPCCGLTMKNIRAARLVADLVYPLAQ